MIGGISEYWRGEPVFLDGVAFLHLVRPVIATLHHVPLRSPYAGIVSSRHFRVPLHPSAAVRGTFPAVENPIAR
jgi:hypothetical protein